MSKPEPPPLFGYAERNLDAIDASVFNGDCYRSPEGRARFEWYIKRWQRWLDESADQTAGEQKC